MITVTEDTEPGNYRKRKVIEAAIMDESMEKGARHELS